MTQSNLIDHAIHDYGNPSAVPVLIADNPQLFPGDREFELTSDISTTETLTIRNEDAIKDKKVLKELDGKIVLS